MPYLANAGWMVDEVDVEIDAEKHYLRREEETRGAILAAVSAGSYHLVWLGTPCFSFSVLHLDEGRPRLRSRREPEGCTPIPARWKAYLAKYNGFVEMSLEVATAARQVGATFVVENPVDRGTRQPPHFSWRFESTCHCG